MRLGRVQLGAGAIMAAGLLVYFADASTLAALAPAILVHELGHLTAMRLLGLKPRQLRVELTGLCIEYGGVTGPAGHMLIAAAGPAAGVGYALASSWLGRASYSGTALLSAGMSLLLSLFNLLPVYPLDGGRIVSEGLELLLGAERGERGFRIVSTVAAWAVFLLAVWLAAHGYGAAMVLPGAFLVLTAARQRIS